ncbi:MAG: HEAT repeat domain-containing protein [Streptomyces sp.]|uniref:HEAT repeat domain-containing protein n=1 Tax=Streptomyces sp. TaxID=1931 RepID=UPI003D6A7EA0
MAESRGLTPLPQPCAPARDWVRYDLAVRRIHSWFPQPGTVPEQAGVPSEALCHGDGRVREAALRGEIPDGLLSLVVLRCADWAGPVRDAARAVLTGAAPETLVDAAETVLRVAARRHGGYAEELLLTRLAQGEQALQERAFTHPSRRVRRWAFRQAVEGGSLTVARLAEGAVSDPDVLVQETCATAALASSPVPEDVHDRMLSARAARVRAIAVTVLRRTGRQGKAEAMLTDRSAMVRACAQWAVRTTGSEPARHYRTALASGGALTRGVVAGLGECGGKADAALLTPLLTDPRAAVRAAAVGALHNLGAAHPECLAPLLDDPSPAVVRRVAVALEPDACTLPVDGLRARLAPEHPGHVRRAALRLLGAHSRGLAPLRAALALVDDADPALRARAHALATRWSPPDSAALCAALPARERARLSAEIEQAAPSLGPHPVRVLRWILQL